jgi:hypothetical protein
MGSNHTARTPGLNDHLPDATTAAPAVSMSVSVRISAAVHGFGQIE